MRGVIAAAADVPEATAAGVVAAAAAAAPIAALRKFIAVRTAGSSTHGGVCIQTAAVHTFLRELRGMPLHAAVAAAAAEAARRDGGSTLDTVLATDCYSSPGGGCGPSRTPAAAAGQAWAACAVEPASTPQQEQQERQQQGQRQAPGTAAAATSSDAEADELRATAAASSSPALAASAAEPAVREDLSVERACMLLLVAPKEVWREIRSERVRDEVLALLDTSAHSGGGQGAGGWQ